MRERRYDRTQPFLLAIQLTNLQLGPDLGMRSGHAVSYTHLTLPTTPYV